MRTYHGRTNKLALAHDEWLELTNKDFTMYPSVRTLDETSRQGQFLGLTKKCKRVIETIYSPGAIIDCIVHCSRTGSKGNCSQEKMLISEVVGLFLGDPFDKHNLGQKLRDGYMMTLQGNIKTKLDRKRLEREMTYIQHEDSAGILLNGVNHIYGRIAFHRERERQSNLEQLPENLHDIIDEVMEYEPKLLVPNIDDHIFSDEEGIDDNGADDEEQDLAVDVGGEMVRPCLMDLVKVGWDKLREINVKKIRMAADERSHRKRTTTQYIIGRVATMKQDLMANSIPPEKEDVEYAEWVSYLRELRSD